MASTQELTRRIKSIKSTRKVTRAMQMISAAKMRKSQAATVASRTYSELALDLVRSLPSLSLQGGRPGDRRGNLDTGLAQDEIASSQSFLAMTEGFLSAAKALVVVISTNKGLVGGFNSNLFAQIKKLEGNYGADNLEYIIMGRKAMDMAVRLRRRVLADFAKSESISSIDQIVPVARLVTDSFITGEYTAVYIVYNHFISTLSQQARTVQLLPLNFPPPEEGLREVIVKDNNASKVSMTPSSSPSLHLRQGYGGPTGGGGQDSDFLIEPSPEKVLSHLLPKVLESQIYQTLLESDASEHSARMIMMKNATESAGDLIADLTLTFNQLRQNKITTELSEITAGKIALEGTN